MVHSGALVSHYLLRPLSSAAVVAVAAAPVATVLDHSSSSSSSVPSLPRLPTKKSCVNLPSIVPKPFKPSSALVAASSSSSSSSYLSSQRKSTSILIVSKGTELPECSRNSGEEASHKKKGRLVYEAHSPYRSVAAAVHGRFRRQRRSIVAR
uniref:Secreted protein n=1 Tax=Anopheles maculatus TaxID=74869 RepID=A0A182SPR0_9DIPT